MSKTKKRHCLKAELLVLVCVLCIWATKALIIDNTKIEIEPVSLQAHTYEDKPDYHKRDYAEKQENDRDEQNSVRQACVKRLDELDAKPKEITPANDVILEQQINDLDTRLRNINENVVQQRQKIEEWYSTEYAKLEEWKQKRLGQLNLDAEIAKAKYHQDMRNTVSNTHSFNIGGGRATTNIYMPSDYYGTANTYMDTSSVSLDSTSTYVVGDPAGRYTAELHRIENEKKAIEPKFSHLRQQKERYLAEIERQANNARIQGKATNRLTQKNSDIKLAGGPGLVSAVSISGENKLIMIEGKILYQGDSINGFTVSGIYPDRIEFEKSGKTWVQKTK